MTRSPSLKAAQERYDAKRSGEREQVSIRLTAEAAAELDRARGETPRAEFVRSAMMAAIRRALPRAR